MQSAMWVEGSCGPHYLLSSYSGHLALPGGNRVFHRDQWWMPVPIIRGQNTSLRAGVSGSPPRWLSRRRRTGSADPWAAALLSRSVPLDVLALALLIDLAWGEPPARIHPTVLIGKTISAAERRAPAADGAPGAQVAYAAMVAAAIPAAWGVLA